MKIYEIGTGYTPIPAKMGAATEIVVEELTKAMLKQGADVEIIDIQAADRLPNQLPITEVKVPRIFAGTDVQLGIMHKLKRVVYSVCLARKLAGILKKTDEKIVLHFHNQYNMFFYLKLVSRKLRQKVHVAYTVHSYVWHDNWEEIENTVHKRYFQEICCVKNSDSVFVLNKQTKKTFIQKLSMDEEKVHLINNGVNTKVYYPLKQDQKEEIKKKWGVEGKKVLIQVGSVCDRKNQMHAIELIMPLLKANSQVVYCYAGGIVSEEYQQMIQKLAEENGVKEQVRYLGEVRPGINLNEVYNLAEAMIFPSKAEGFSLVIIEAMSAGIPVIVSDQLEFALAKDCYRYISDDMVQSIIVDEIFDAKKHLVDGFRVRNAVLEQFSWEQVAQKYCETWGREDELKCVNSTAPLS